MLLLYWTGTRIPEKSNPGSYIVHHLGNRFISNINWSQQVETNVIFVNTLPYMPDYITMAHKCKQGIPTSNMHMNKNFQIGKTQVRIILWCPITKMLIKACFLVQPLEQEGVYQKCCISLCSEVFINHFYQMKASPECLNILTYCSKYWVDRLRRTIGRKV